MRPIWLDTATVRQDAGTRTAWVRFVYGKPQHRSARGSVPAYTYTEFTAKYVVDCSNGKLKTLDLIFYEASGSVARSFSEDGYETFEEPVPESIGESIVKGVCKRYP